MMAANADVTVSELSGRLAPLAVGWILGPAAAGVYAVAQRATAVLAQPAQILGQAAYAELAALAAAGDRGQRIRATVVRAVQVAVMAAAPVCLLIALFGERLATLMAGPAFATAGSLMLWLAVARTIQLAAPPMSAALTALGRPGLSAGANVVSGLGLLLALPPMLYWLGLTGGGLHAVIQAATGVGLLALCARNETGAARRWGAGAGA
jgi:O-antigen/teichoic acid export membrane protein